MEHSFSKKNTPSAGPKRVWGTPPPWVQKAHQTPHRALEFAPGVKQACWGGGGGEEGDPTPPIPPGGGV